jgi:glyceraldehyde-3-phosphate dehydrogenase/erythrose-4-phosphate dehydrogenase
MAKAPSLTSEPGVSVTAVNDPAPLVKPTYLLRGDMVYGRYGKTVESEIRETARL